MIKKVSYPPHRPLSPSHFSPRSPFSHGGHTLTPQSAPALPGLAATHLRHHRRCFLVRPRLPFAAAALPPLHVESLVEVAEEALELGMLAPAIGAAGGGRGGVALARSCSTLHLLRIRSPKCSRRRSRLAC